MKPKIYYGMHFEPGVAEYNEGNTYRVLVRQETINDMNPSFAGRALHIRHVDKANYEKNDGYVVESFYNKYDGKTWCKFIVTSQEADNKISEGWTLSNSYIVKEKGPSGLSKGVKYDYEVLKGEADHMALVPVPKYEGSVIMTPEQYKEYCDKKKAELERVSNSGEKQKEKKKMGLLNLFKKEKLDNSAELEQTMVTLPKSKKDVTIAEAVELADKHVIQNAGGYANGDHKVKAGDEEMTVNELVSKYVDMKNKGRKKNEDKEKEENAQDPEDEKKNKGRKKNEDKEKEENAQDPEDEKNSNSGESNFDRLANAHNSVPAQSYSQILLAHDKVALGRKRYGSK